MITQETLSEMYNRLWTKNHMSGAKYFRQKGVFEDMAKELNVLVENEKEKQ